MEGYGDSGHVGWRGIVALLLGGIAIGPGLAGAQSGAEEVAGEPVRYAVSFLVDTAAFTVGAEYEGARIVAVNDAIDFIAVLAERPADFKARASGDARVVAIEEMPLERMIEDAPVEALEDGPSASYTPVDPQYVNQYGAPQIRMPNAWDYTLGNSNGAVCVVDTGVRYTHEDLAGSRWRGGRDVINNDNDPWDDHGHGTHVQGTAAATISNGLGVAGMGNVWHYHAKALNYEGSGTQDQVASAITWCADNTPTRTVISLSLGASGGSTVLQNAVNYAYYTKGKLVVAAAGNDACTNCVGYPAAYDAVIAVTCTRSGETLCSFSSTGPQAELAAPGNSIVSTCFTSNSAYCYKSGTSMSTPHVSGVAALYWSYNTGLSASALRARLQSTAQDLGSAGRDSSFGYGEIDAYCLFNTAAPNCPGGGQTCSGGPSNNCFSSPIVIGSSSYSNSQTTLGATLETNEPRPCGSIGSTVWYRYTPGASGTITIDTYGSSFDTVLAVYVGSSLSGLSNLACNDDDAGAQSRVQFSGSAGTTYQIQVGGFNSATGSLSIRLQAAPPPCGGGPSNNCFSSAYAVSSPSSTSGSNSGATMEAGEPSPCGALGASVWYSFTPSVTAAYTADTVNGGTSFDTVVAVYTGSSVGSLTNIGCNDDFGGAQSSVTWSGVAGTTYRIQVGGYNGATGSFTLDLTGGSGGGTGDCGTGGDAGDSFDTATLVSVPITCSATLETAALELNIIAADYYRFHANAGQTIRVTYAGPLTGDEWSVCTESPSGELADCVPFFGSTLTTVASETGQWRVSVLSFVGGVPSSSAYTLEMRVT